MSAPQVEMLRPGRACVPLASHSPDEQSRNVALLDGPQLGVLLWCSLSDHVARTCSEPPSESDDDGEQRGGQGDGEMDIWQRGSDDAARHDAGQADDGATQTDAGVWLTTAKGRRPLDAVLPCVAHATEREYSNERLLRCSGQHGARHLMFMRARMAMPVR